MHPNEFNLVKSERTMTDDYGGLLNDALLMDDAQERTSHALALCEQANRQRMERGYNPLHSAVLINHMG